MKNKGEQLCKAIIGNPETIPANGSEKLRNVVEWMNSRDEYLNENKSHLQLIKEFNKATQ